MKKLLSIILLAALAACASVPQKSAPPAAAVKAAPAPQSFVVHQFELLTIEYTSPTTVDAIDANGPADKIYSCGRAGAAGVAQGQQLSKGHAVYVPTCIPIVFKGPIPHGAVAVQPVARNAHVLFWASEALDYDAHGVFLKGNQPQGPFHSSAECVMQSLLDVKGAYARGVVSKTDSLVVYCVPILAYGSQANGSESVHFVPYTKPCPWFPAPGAGACQLSVTDTLGNTI